MTSRRMRRGALWRKIDKFRADAPRGEASVYRCGSRMSPDPRHFSEFLFKMCRLEGHNIDPRCADILNSPPFTSLRIAKYIYDVIYI